MIPAARQEARRGGTQRLTHGDLAAEHGMLDPDTRRLVGILDWSDAALGDPASDLVGFWLWKGEAFVRRVLESRPLPAEEQWIERARFSVRYAALLDVARAHQLGDAALVETERRWLLEAFEPHECGSARLTSA